MNFFSAIGDGEHYFYFNMIFFILGRQYEFVFLTMAFCMNVHWITFLKMSLRHSRPQFDDKTIGIVNNSSICSGEFGNPSGHTLMTSQQTLTALFFFKQIWAEWLRTHKWVARLLELFVFVMIVGISSCRLYLGRHGLDQIFLGILLGTWSAFFFNGVFKKHFYDPVFTPDVDSEHPKVTAARSLKAAKYAAIVYLAILIKMICLYIYVDTTFEIPSDWKTSLTNTCPKLKKSHTFHHFSLACTGYVAVMPSFFLWNYLKHRDWACNGITFESSAATLANQSTGTLALEAFIRCGLFVVVEIVGKKLPMMIYGHNDLDAFPDLVKRSVEMFLLTWVATRFTDWLRTKLYVPLTPTEKTKKAQ